MKILTIGFIALGIAITIGAPASRAQTSDEAARLVQNLQDSWNKKNGTQWSTSFAAEHDYVVINGMFLPKISPKQNAEAHQRIFDTIYKEVDLTLRVAKIRSLTAELGVVHVQGHTHQKGKPDEKRAEVIITGVVRKFPDGWKIVAFQNTPVEQRSGPPPRS